MFTLAQCLYTVKAIILILKRITRKKSNTQPRTVSETNTKKGSYTIALFDRDFICRYAEMKEEMVYDSRTSEEDFSEYIL